MEDIIRAPHYEHSLGTAHVLDSIQGMSCIATVPLPTYVLTTPRNHDERVYKSFFHNTIHRTPTDAANTNNEVKDPSADRVESKSCCLFAGQLALKMLRSR
jgi:hypothetical protein